MYLLDVLHIQTLCYVGNTEVRKTQSLSSQGLLSSWAERTATGSYKTKQMLWYKGSCADHREGWPWSSRVGRVLRAFLGHWLLEVFGVGCNGNLPPVKEQPTWFRTWKNPLVLPGFRSWPWDSTLMPGLGWWRLLYSVWICLVANGKWDRLHQDSDHLILLSFDPKNHKTLDRASLCAYWEMIQMILFSALHQLLSC